MSLASIIIPTFNREKILDHTISAILAATRKMIVEIIVVNDSQVNRLDFGSFPNVRVLNNPKKGPASARSFGAKVSCSELLIFMDDDFIITEEAFVRATENLRKFPDYCFNANWTYPEALLNNIEKKQFGRFLISIGFTSLKGKGNGVWDENSLFENPAGLGSGFFAITRENYFKSGGYDEDYLFAGEDLDLEKKLKMIGVKVMIDPKLIVYHNEEDRVSLYNWLERQKKGRETLNSAIKKGYKEVHLKYGVFRRIILEILLLAKPTLLLILKLVPNIKLLDNLYFLIVKILWAVSIYEGNKISIK